MVGFPRNVKCKVCGKEFVATCPRSKYCGNREKKTGCSYEMRKKYYRGRKDYMIEYKSKDKEKWKKYDREKKRKYRENKEYLKKERLQNKKWRDNNKDKLSEWSKKYRKENIEKVLERNRKRALLKRGVVGTHTKQEWIELCNYYNNRCVYCGAQKKLTKDHIIPIIKNGTDYIDNIQPLCQSCNSRKHAHITIYNFGVYDMIHFGHIISLNRARELGDKLIVGIFTDEVAESFKRKPTMNIEERIKTIKELNIADEIVIQTELNPINNALKYGADIIAKGAGAGFEKMVNKRQRIKCILLPYTEGISTSEIIERIKKCK